MKLAHDNQIGRVAGGVGKLAQVSCYKGYFGSAFTLEIIPLAVGEITILRSLLWYCADVSRLWFPAADSCPGFVQDIHSLLDVAPIAICYLFQHFTHDLGAATNVEQFLSNGRGQDAARPLSRRLAGDC